MDWIFLLLAGSSGVLFTIGDILLKYWSEGSGTAFMISSFALYIIAGLLLALALKRRELAIAVAILLVFNVVTVAILGFTIFNEVLGLKEILGITFAIAAIILLMA